MKSRIVSVASETGGGLTTLERVKLELNITGTTHDRLLRLKIKEATSDIEARIRPIRRAAVVEDFWPEAPIGLSSQKISRSILPLSRYPISTVTSIIVDGTAVGIGAYRIVHDTGELHFLDSAGAPSLWDAATLATVTYSAGYLFPEDTGEDLPPVLESAAVEMLTMFWMARGRDPLLKSEENPGVSRFEYWVGAIGPTGDLPPSIQGKLLGFAKSPVFA
jgi:hypothetical protein